MIETYRGVSLVTLANDEVLLSTSTVMGGEHGPPLWVRCIADGTDKRPASRITIVRWPGESCTALWARVLSAIRELKQSRGIYHQVRVVCCQSAPPLNAEQGDTRFNLMRALWHDADHQRDPFKRVIALCLLHDVVSDHGEFPRFQ